MAEYTATIQWRRQDGETFNDNRYSRAHEWMFDGGVTVPASASPHIVPLPYSVAENVDPEEAFVAALSSCHMLVFLGIAAKRRYVVDRYIDEAVGVMAENEAGKLAVTRVTLRPRVLFSGDRRPSPEQIEKLHHLAHDECFIANSVRTEVMTEPRF
ncbi:putative redox protein [Alloalcanivorax dieselolei B5]|uniref:Putative redox protein n=1 Tax=Alcanivorax dieselolei (strain DSM 16502 / CGMCC 1.3690 / MCCC 1A00001 / B-5) TaxID=930169 RepID=K0C959_ALCDB|nr:OsmC family protein [Alloalcanivorax dieselolei]AFT69113.1 putative redox protein [Alloalcanivorax dieselolei B5]GGJ82653.1 peroxiredoxin [Alloalcanivorax dieselolei]